jgi:hypothetical protein
MNDGDGHGAIASISTSPPICPTGASTVWARIDLGLREREVLPLIDSL